MIKDIRKARRDFIKACVTKKGCIRLKLLPAIDEILSYKNPLRLKQWVRPWSSWLLKNAGLYSDIINLLDIMGCSYKITNDSATGKNAAYDIIHISPRGLIRAKSILKDYNISNN